MSDRILIESNSPVCPAQAFAEEAGGTVYFYIMYPNKPKDERIKVCWVCNTAPAPAEFDPDSIRAGHPPKMPAANVAHDINGITISQEGLEIVWFSEGNCAALLQNGRILAAIPEWSGMKGFHGYARYAKGTGNYAWELTNAEENLGQRVKEARRLWDFVNDDYWQHVQALHVGTDNRFFGKPYSQYYAIDNGEFPPRAVIEGERDGVRYGFTAGISVFPQPMIGMYVRHAEEHRRIEFGFAAEESCSAANIEAYNCFLSLGRFIRGDMCFFAHGHTNTWEGIPGFAAFLFCNSRALMHAPAPEYPRFMGDIVNLLWAIPLTQAEYDFVVRHDVNELMHRAKDITRVHIFDDKPKFKV